MKARVHAEDLRFETEWRLFCKGSALVKLESLNWEEHKTRQHDPKNVLRLKKVFEKEGCRSLKVGNHIPAIVDQHHLDTAIENAKQNKTWKTGILPSSYATIDSENRYPELDFPGGIICLHGLHRIQAGKALRPAEKWWIVDLYLSGISYEMRAILDEEYSNEDRPCDGQIYRKIREYQYLPQKADALILPATCKRLRGLFRHRLVAAGFDALTKIPALFDAGMKVTTLHTVMATRCYETHLRLLEFGRAVINNMSNDQRVRDTATPTLFHPDIHKRNIFVSDDDPTVITGIVDWQSASIEPAFWYAEEVPDFATTLPHPSLENQLEPNSERCAKAFEVCTQFHVPKLGRPRVMDDALFRPFRYCYRTWKDGAMAFRHELIKTSERWQELGLMGSCPYPAPTPEELAIHQKEYKYFEAAHDLRNNLAGLLNTASDGWVPPEDWKATKLANRELFEVMLQTVLSIKNPDDDEPTKDEGDTLLS
ncbi:hypothetical protein VC83_04180 [Pseudogymnoascus destructans]|uniref:Altered inheritance of mitochondria protein 9, mitochondrial n=1 Tax=Pseudogymnoascus destructans TaxID=655981 RepID=A0A177AAX8_9PEZI|nr:uncharacterized protein VC83_04180 [Pseudogymnoascus destructans]OAF59237.1 hypothetical protein VC83_04180 [Pseudogymnoascus destructans]